MRIRVALIVLLALALPTVAAAQANVVYPQTAGQNHVRWDAFDWKYVDLLDDEDLGAGLRLYFYEDEREVAERAAAAIEEEYRWLVQQFDHRPKARIPYILYNSHGELEQTNLFQIGESTLGVTSPEDLRMTAAYWGDHSRFRHVSLHEMVHQFTIQKVNSVAAKAKARASPLMDMPLWFIEGLAEYYSTPGGLAAEDEAFLRDIVVNPDPSRGYVLMDFFSDDQRSFAFTYKLGQARVFFLAETYGAAKLQEILSHAWRMASRKRGNSLDMLSEDERDRSRAVLSFEALVREVTGDRASVVDAKWQDWIKRRAFEGHLAAKQSYSDLHRIEGTGPYIDWFTVSDDGRSILFRTIDPWTGVSQLLLGDPRDPGSARRIARDNHPGVDSLHYFDRPIGDLGAKKLVWIARSGPRDVLRVGEYDHDSRDRERGGELVVDADFDVGSFRTWDPERKHIREMGSPALSPDGKSVAFVGLDDDGVSDVWVLDFRSGDYTRVTNDLYSERELDWGEDGIVYSSDATESRLFNLFLADPETKESRRLTWTRWNQRFPRFVPGERKIAFAGDENGKMDLYVLSLDALERAPVGEPGAEIDPVAGTEEDPPLLRVTDAPTGLSQPSPTVDRLYGIAMKAGSFRVYSVKRDEMLAETRPLTEPFEYQPWTVHSRELKGAHAYDIWSTKSWDLENAFAVLGGGNGIYGGGFLLFNDKMRDRTVLVEAQAFGRFDLTEAQVTYIDRTHRTAWGTAAFVRPVPVLDPEFTTPERPIFFFERKFGALGLVEYPLNRYFRVGTTVGLAGNERFIPGWLDNFANEAQRTAWEERNAGIEPEVDTAVSTGYDTLNWSMETGPLHGTSALVTASSYYQPGRAVWHGDLQLDVQRYFRLYRTANLGFRFAGGRALGDEWRRPFYISSVDNLRGVPWHAFEYLIADQYAIGQAELQVPLNSLIRFFLFQNVEGIAAIDVGSLVDRTDEFRRNSTAAFVTGLNFSLAIFEFRLHFARPFDIGGLEPGVPRDDEGGDVVPDGWVTNFSIRYTFF